MVRDSISFDASSLSVAFAGIPETIRLHFRASCLGCSILDPSSIHCCLHYGFFLVVLVPHRTCFSCSKASFFPWTCPACVQCCFTVRFGARTCSLCRWVLTCGHDAHSSSCELFSSWVACSSFALQWQPCATSLFASCRLHMRAAARRLCIWVLLLCLIWRTTKNYFLVGMCLPSNQPALYSDYRLGPNYIPFGVHNSHLFPYDRGTCSD